MSRPATQRPSIWSRIAGRGMLVTLALIVFGGVILPEAIKVVTAPWAVTWLPGPKLAGTWDGPLRARQGSEYRVFLDLRYADEREQNLFDNNLAGTARVCTRHGQTYEYGVSGGVNAFSQRVKIGLGYGDPRLSGLGFALVGRWEGAPLRLTASDNPFDPDGIYRHGSPRSTADPDDSFLPTELTPGSLADFETSCRRIAAIG